MEEAIFFKSVEDRMFVRVQGHITASHCPELKTLCFSRLERKPRISAVYFDLSSCEYMDSTFLGLIVGITKRLMTLSSRKISLLGTSPTCHGLLKTIGVLGLVELGPVMDFPSAMEKVGKGAIATAEFLLNTHEELASLSSENRAKFNALTTMLRDSKKRSEGGHET